MPNSRGSELVAVLGVDALSGYEVEGERWSGGVGRNVDFLGSARDEVHLDAGFFGVPEREVSECPRVEVGAQFTIEPNQHIAIEGGCDALAIVIGALDGSERLCGSGAEVGTK